MDTLILKVDKAEYEFTAPIAIGSLSEKAILALSCVVGEDGKVTGFEQAATTAESLKNAIESLQSGKTLSISLGDDITLDETLTVPAGATVNLDLNGKTLTTGLQQEGRHHYAIDNYGTIIIEGESGTINARGVQNFGAMTIDGNITITNVDTNGGSAIWNEGTLIVNKGTFTTNGESGVGSYGSALNTRSNGEATINGGTFIANSQLTYAILNAGKITINNAIVSGKHGAVATEGQATTTIKGGTFTQTDNPSVTDHCVYGTTTIYGGTFSIESLEETNGGKVFYNEGCIADGYKVVQNSNGKYVVVESFAVSTTEELQAAFDSATDGQTIQLTPGVNYGVIYMGRPTGSNNTKMVCGNSEHSSTYTDEVTFKNHLEESGWHGTPKYTTTLKNLTVNGAEGATIAGLVASSGHFYGNVHDYVLDKDYTGGSAYYLTLNLKNIKFSKVNFTGKIDINTSEAESVYDGITFDGCTFTTGGTESTNGAAIRYYNEANNGNVKNIVVTGCIFENCYQGVYVHHVNGITITESSFDNTGHNAIGIQNHAGAVNLKNLVITDNTFTKIGDRVIRFGDVGADSNITITGNTATNSGDEDGEVIKATSITTGITTSISNNNWNGTVVNDELKDK